MIERRFISSSGVTQLSVHLLQAVLTAKSLNGITNGQALSEINNSLGASPLIAAEQTDLVAVSNWVNAGLLSLDKIERWFKLESVIMLANHGGPLYGSENLLKSKLENLIGSLLG